MNRLGLKSPRGRPYTGKLVWVTIKKWREREERMNDCRITIYKEQGRLLGTTVVDGRGWAPPAFQHWDEPTDGPTRQGVESQVSETKEMYIIKAANLFARHCLL